MALQGSYIDIVTGAFAAALSSNGTPNHVSVIHSLGTAPDFGIPVITTMGVQATGGMPALIYYGGNASVATVGMMTGSTTGSVVLSNPAFSFSLMLWKLHSIIK